MLHEILSGIAVPAIVIVELIGLSFLLIAFIIALYQLIVLDRLNFQQFNVRPELRSGMITALEILMVAEIIKTINSVTVSHVVVVALLVLVRLFMANTLEKEIEKHKEEHRLEERLEEALRKTTSQQKEIRLLTKKLGESGKGNTKE